MLSGLLTGVMVSLLLVLALAKSGRGTAILLGALSLPLGAFVFGVMIWLVHWLVPVLGRRECRDVAPIFSPLAVGAQYALVSMISVFAFILFPMAIGTTVWLRRVIHSPPRRERPA